MTFKELQAIVDKNHYTLEDNHDFWNLTRGSGNDRNVINISKQSMRIVFFNINFISDGDMDVIEASIKYSKTPIAERQQETRYIIPLPHLVTTGGKQQYLTHNGSFFASRRDKKLRQTWKEEHLKYIPEEYRKYAIRMSEDEK